MIYKIQKYNMVVNNVVAFEMRSISDAFDIDGEDYVKVYYALHKEKADNPSELEVAWARQMDVPWSIYELDRKFKRNQHTQEDVNALNAFLTAIGAPEIVVLMDQEWPIPEGSSGDI